jgi:hypothetical protein
MPNMRFVWIAGAVITGWIAASSLSARAELRVMESNVRGVTRDTVFPDGANFDVPSGKKIKFLKKPGNTTHEIVGPYRGTLADYRPGWGGERNNDIEGGTRGTAPVSGGTRGFSPPK